MSTSSANPVVAFSAALAVCIAGGAGIAFWLMTSDAADVAVREPGQAARPPVRQNGQENPNPGTLIPGPGKPSELKGSWAQFRGPDRTGIAPPANLAKLLAPGGTKPLWTATVCEGYAAPAVHNGRVYLTDYDRQRKEDAVRCLSLDDGKEIWRYTYHVRIKMNHGITRTMPAVTDGYVVSLGPKCHVLCLNAVTGELVWKKDLVGEHGTTVPPWYAGQCPLIDGEEVILAPGGDPLMMAVHLAYGTPRWQTANPGGFGMTHSSIVKMTFAGEPQYVYCHTRGVVGVAAETGKILWNHDGWRISIANIATPIPVSGGRIFLSGGYGSGAAMIRLVESADAIRVEELFRVKPEVFGAEQQTPVLLGDHLYGVIPPRARSRLVCLDLAGRHVWATEPGPELGLGSYALAGDTLLVFEENTGVLRLVRATPARLEEIGRVKAIDGHEIWTPPVVAAGRLLVRSATTLICLDVS